MASLKKINGSYYLYFTNSRRQPRQKSVALKTRRKETALKLKVQYEDKYALGEFDPWQPGEEASSVTLEGAAELWLRRREIKDSSREMYRARLNTLFRVVPPSTSLERLPIARIKAWIAAPEAQATQAGRYRVLSALLTWSVQAGWLGENPMRKMKPPRISRKIGRYFTPQDIDRLMIAADHLQTKPYPVRMPYMKDLITVALYTGLRQGVLLRLCWQEVDLDGGYVTATGTKSGHDRRVPLIGQALAVLRRRYADGEARLAGEDYVFTRERAGREPARSRPARSRPAGTSEPIPRNLLQAQFRRCVQTAGLPSDLTFHSLRHSCGSYMAMAGVPLIYIQQLLGHSSTRMTEIYLHANPEHLRTQMQEVFPALFGERDSGEPAPHGL